MNDYESPAIRPGALSSAAQLGGASARRCGVEFLGHGTNKTVVVVIVLR